MKKTRGFLSVLFVVILSLYCSGCIFIVGGTVGALGGYAISRDTIQGEVDIPFSGLWSSSLDVLGVMGAVISEDRAKGIIEGEVDKAVVKVTLEQLTSKTARLRISARRFMLPKIGIAQKAYVKIISRAKR